MPSLEFKPGWAGSKEPNHQSQTQFAIRFHLQLGERLKGGLLLFE
jgi:hypothetical protein